MLVDGGAIAWVATAGAPTPLPIPRWRSLTCTIVLAPGFVDSHTHLTETEIALDSLQLADLPLRPGIARRRRRLLRFHRRRHRPGPRLGRDRVGDPTLPSHEELEHAAGGRQVYLFRVDVHSALVSSSLAAAAAGLEDRAAPVRADKVKLAAHTAARLAARRLPAAALRGYQQQALAEAAANGYVALAEMAAPHIGSIDDLQLGRGLEHRAGRRSRRSCPTGANWPPGRPRPVHNRWTGWACRAGAGRGPEHRRFDRVTNRGAAFGLHRRAGGAGRPVSLGRRGGSPPRGVLAARGPGRVPRHGDAGLDAALDALDLAAAEVGEQKVRAAGHRLEHVELADAESISRLAGYSVTVSAQPGFEALPRAATPVSTVSTPRSPPE